MRHTQSVLSILELYIRQNSSQTLEYVTYLSNTTGWPPPQFPPIISAYTMATSVTFGAQKPHNSSPAAVLLRWWADPALLTFLALLILNIHHGICTLSTLGHHTLVKSMQHSPHPGPPLFTQRWKGMVCKLSQRLLWLPMITSHPIAHPTNKFMTPQQLALSVTLAHFPQFHLSP